MKISKSALKTLVKECLVEILSEGMGPSLNENLAKTHRKATSPLQESNRRQITPSLHDAIVSESKGDAVLASILADTAASTLPMMLQNDSKSAPMMPRPAGLAEQVVAAADPDQIFGDEVAAKWSDLAFMDSKLKK